MKLSEQELKELYQRQTAGRQRTGCPTGETFVRAVAGELNQVENERVTNHLIACSECAHEYRLLHSLRPLAEQLAGASGESAGEERAVAGHVGRRARIRTLRPPLVRSPRWRAAVLVATVAAVMAGSVALWQWTQRSDRPTPHTRGELSMTMNVDPPDQSVLEEAPRQLSWPAVESADRYQVLLYDFESTPIWESPLVTDTSVALPEPVRQRLQPGQTAYWRVIVREAIERRQSRLFQFVFTAKARQ